MRVALVLVLVALPGCYRSHERRPDAGDPCVVIDAGADDDAILSVEPEPDIARDERPSGPWQDVAPPAADAVALVPVGEPVLVDSPLSFASPALVWNGCGFGAVTGPFRALDPSGAPADAEARIFETGSSDTPGVAFAAGRYVVAVQGRRGIHVTSLDRRLGIATGADPTGDLVAGDDFATSVDVARLAAARAWIVTAVGGIDTGPVIMIAADDRLEPIGDPMVLDPGPAIDVRVAGARSRALVAWTSGTALLAQSIAGPGAVDGEPFEVMSVPTGHWDDFEVATLRDRIAIVATGVHDAWFASVDPWAHTVRSSVVSIESGRRPWGHPAIAATDLGFAVACWGTLEGSVLTMQVVGADGARWGAPLEIEGVGSSFDCAWNGTDVVVISPRTDREGLFTQRVHPTLL